MPKPRISALRNLCIPVLFLGLAACGEDSPTDSGGVNPQSVCVAAASTDVEVAAQVQLTATVSPAAAPQTVAWS